MIRVDNAIIMAAGTSARFAPLSYEKHKALTVVKDEVLIERQIRQLKDARIPDIYIVTGYKAEQFDYLAEQFDVRLIHNSDYLTRNNNGSIWAVKEILANSYICSADNYFSTNPFECDVNEAYYAAVYADGHTEEWCMTEDADGYIDSVTVGGENAWYMLGHTFWNREFSEKFIRILSAEYNQPETADKLWEKIFIAHLDVLKMKIRRYGPNIIYEFDTLDELREFDTSYVTDTRSSIIKSVVSELNIKEDAIVSIKNLKGTNAEAIGFEFDCPLGHFKYIYNTQKIVKS